MTGQSTEAAFELEEGTAFDVEANAAWLEIEHACDRAELTLGQRAILRDPLNRWSHLIDMAARPEPPVEGALEEALNAVLPHVRARHADMVLRGETAVAAMIERALDALAAARSGHDGLRARITELEEALQFYADHRMPDREVNVSIADPSGIPNSFQYIDHGDVARRALSPDPE